MPIKFSNDKPIFIQLADIIRGDILSGKYLKNAKLPSVRDLALTYAINPNTVQKSLQLLENDGLIVTDRTNGKFVSENADEINLQKNKTIQQEIENFIERMKSFGLDNKEIKELINKIGE